jgi:hypothetical protein
VGRRWTWVAWSMLVIFLVGVGVGLPLMVANGDFQQDPAQQASLLLAFTAFMVMGAVLVAHRPGNVIGWIFSAVGLLTGTGLFAWQYAEYAYLTRGSPLPGAMLGAWYNNWFWYPTVTLSTVFTLLVFPTGRLLSARWRPVAWLTAAITAMVVVLSALAPTLNLGERTKLHNPVGLAAIPNPERGALGSVLFGLLPVCTAAAVVSLVLRFRRSQGVERQQLKWFTFAGVLLFAWSVVDPVLPEVALLQLVYGLTIALVPVAAGIAVLRYRLYDIDRLINRTLVYGLLTALLGGVYASVVLVLGQLLGQDSSLAVAGATLAVAALFQPARRRIQQVVDRRFNRRRYDAAKTIEAFSARLRDEIDLDTLAAELLAVVDQTMQPTRLSLWLRPFPGRVVESWHRPASGPTALGPSRRGL